MLHALIQLWFQWVHDWGYWGIFFLMALESTIVPVPSEVVMPPAAFWAAQGKLDFHMVVIAGTAGSYAGAALSFLVARALGQRLVERMGKYFFLSPEKIIASEKWVKEFGPPGVFAARLIPVIRHLISVPSGFFKMDFRIFSITTILGAGLWCYVLSWFGARTLGEHPEMLNSPADMVHMIKSELLGFVLGVISLLALYALFMVYKKKASRSKRISRL